MKFTTSILLSLALAAAAPLHAQEPSADLRLDQTREVYGAATWHTGPVHDGLRLGALRIPGLRGDDVRLRGGLITRSFSVADAPLDARPLLRVWAYIADDQAEAREALIRELAAQQSPVPAAEDGAFGFELGDAGFVRPGGNGTASQVLFVRGNIAIRIARVDRASTSRVSLLTVARAVDAAIAARPVLSEGRPARPEITKLEPAVTEVQAGKQIPLAVTAVDPEDGEVALQWIVGGDGQGYVERRDGSWLLFTTGPGELRVTLQAVGSTGTVATRTFEAVALPE